MWCRLNGRKDSDFSEMSEIIRTKLLDRSQDMVITQNICTMSGFETLFEQLSSINQKKIVARNPRAASGPASGGSRGAHGNTGGSHHTHTGSGQGGGSDTRHRHSVTGTRYSSHSSLKCDVCSETGHSKYYCPHLKQASSVTEARKKIREKGRCDLCLGLYSAGHQCSETYFSKKLQKEMPRGCRCGSRINAAVCPCGQGRGSRGGGGAHQNPQPRHSGPGPGPASGQGHGSSGASPSGPGPVTVTRSARVSFPSEFIRMNNTILSFSLTICQQMYLVAPNGYKELITVVFDNGSENSQISVRLRAFSHYDTQKLKS